jgi:FtsZ-binding cell division protein ZapB
LKSKDLEIEELKIASNSKDRQNKLLEKNFEALRIEKNKLKSVKKP